MNNIYQIFLEKLVQILLIYLYPFLKKKLKITFIKIYFITF